MHSITNEQYLEFIEDGGYDTYKYGFQMDGKRWRKMDGNHQCIGKKQIINGK
jgi:formylglycine-generating enzyme required for sulfatase activity